MTSSERLDLIEWYAERGWALLPLKAHGKKPRADVANGWSSYRLARERVRRTFADACNVGVLLGEPSHGLVDVDLDCDEALRWAPEVLPATLTFGRASAPRSHWIYRAISEAARVERVLDVPTAANPKGAVLCELRGTGGQTMFPPSIHPSGEVVEWTPDPDADLCELPVDELRQRVKLIAALCLTERHAGLAAAQCLADGGVWPVELHGMAAWRVCELLGLEQSEEPSGQRARAPTGGGWIEQVKAAGPAEVARAFELEELRPGTYACPACGADKRGSREARGSIGLFASGAAWHCYRCDAKGDAVTLASWAAQGTPRPNWVKLRASCAGRGLL